MKVKIGMAIIALILLVLANASVSVARADEQLSASQNTLTLTSGNEQTPFDFSGDSTDTGSTGSDLAEINQSIIPSSAISFSPAPVPEPSTFGLLAMGTAIFEMIRRRSLKNC